MTSRSWTIKNISEGEYRVSNGTTSYFFLVSAAIINCDPIPLPAKTTRNGKPLRETALDASERGRASDFLKRELRIRGVIPSTYKKVAP
ncbi:MAG: hypothetical protein ABA06_02110 [Parcubacteria bacterium C7867-001]|nr:MAG: hypothetical protein ABA06_02110 [Parcubacteria bacterium C7867-001]